MCTWPGSSRAKAKPGCTCVTASPRPPTATGRITRSTSPAPPGRSILAGKRTIADALETGDASITGDASAVLGALAVFDHPSFSD